MRLATIILMALALLAAPVIAQVCPVMFTTANYPSVEGAWNVTETEDRLFDNLLGLCGADAEDFGTSLGDGCLLEASGGALVCGTGGGGSPLEVREVDASPSIASVTQLAFDQADGFVVSTGGAGLSRVDLTVPNDSHSHTGSTVSALDAGDTTTGTFAAAQLPAATTSAQGAVELATSAETTAGLAVQASDPRLSDARTPTGHASGHEDGGADEINAEDLSTGCADGLIWKAQSGKGSCASAGSAAFTTWDSDYGAETYAGPLDMLVGQLIPPGGASAPAAGDCDAAGESGRVFMDRSVAGEPKWWCCEGVAGWAECSGAGGAGPEGDQYSPDREPVTCAVCEDWIDDTATLTWEWVNQDAATETLEMDGSTLVGEATNDEARGRAVDPPSAGNVDFTVTAHIHFAAATGVGCGLGVLDGGTLAAPTNTVYTYADSGSLLFQDDSNFSFTEGVSNIWGAFPAAGQTNAGFAYYVQLRYTDSTRVLSAHWSKDGRTFPQPATGTTTLSNDPIKVFFFARDAATCHMQWFRIRTGADRNFAGE